MKLHEVTLTSGTKAYLNTHALALVKEVRSFDETSTLCYEVSLLSGEMFEVTAQSMEAVFDTVSIVNS